METKEINNREQFIYSELHSKWCNVTCIVLIVTMLVIFGTIAGTLCLYLSKPICPKICFRQTISVVFVMALVVVVSYVIIAYLWKKHLEYKKCLLEELKQIEADRIKKVDAEIAYNRKKDEDNIAKEEQNKIKKERDNYEKEMLDNDFLRDYLKRVEDRISQEQFEKVINNRSLLVTLAEIFNKKKPNTEN